MSRVSDKPYFVSVLWSARGKRFYIGISEDTDHRLEQHNSSAGEHWTARFRPWKLVYREVQPSYKGARQREHQLKKQKGDKGFFRQTGLDPGQFHRGS